jgi:hypothetical protein
MTKTGFPLQPIHLTGPGAETAIRQDFPGRFSLFFQPPGLEGFDIRRLIQCLIPGKNSAPDKCSSLLSYLLPEGKQKGHFTYLIQELIGIGQPFLIDFFPDLYYFFNRVHS